MHKILIVEDDLDFLEILQRRFLEHGYEVFPALDAFQAMEFAHKERPDVIVLDLKLPGGGGSSILRNIKLSAYTKGTPVIISTAMHDEALEKSIRQQGVAAYFRKPYEIEHLILKIKEILSEST